MNKNSGPQDEMVSEDEVTSPLSSTPSSITSGKKSLRKSLSEIADTEALLSSRPGKNKSPSLPALQFQRFSGKRGECEGRAARF